MCQTMRQSPAVGEFPIEMFPSKSTEILEIVDRSTCGKNFAHESHNMWDNRIQHAEHTVLNSAVVAVTLEYVVVTSSLYVQKRTSVPSVTGKNTVEHQYWRFLSTTDILLLSDPTVADHRAQTHHQEGEGRFNMGPYDLGSKEPRRNKQELYREISRLI